MFVFAYGSLLLPASLRATLPETTWRDCIPALLAGHRRDFGVAFPNDGSQQDKAYVDADGGRPPIVLFANIRQAEPRAAGQQEAVNGVCIPVTDETFGLLAGRELRYDAVDVTGAVHPYPSAPAIRSRVLAFTGKARFTRDVAGGVVSRDYAATIADGARFWDTQHPGFHERFVLSTDWPAPQRLRELARIDPRGGKGLSPRASAG